MNTPKVAHCNTSDWVGAEGLGLSLHLLRGIATLFEKPERYLDIEHIMNGVSNSEIELISCADLLAP